VKLFPETDAGGQRLSHPATHWFTRVFARKMIAVSESTKRDLVDKFHIPEEKVERSIMASRILSRCPGPTERPPTSQEEASFDSLPKPFIVCLGTLQPRKNISRLIDPLVLMKQQTGLPHSLVIAGRPGWMCDDLLEKIKTPKDVVYLGYVKDRFALLRRTPLLVQPSVHEGFGLSVLVAFAERVPVACSNNSSLPEVAEDAAELFDPYDVASVANAIRKVLCNSGRAAQLCQQGWERLKAFIWGGCAGKTLAMLSTATRAHAAPLCCETQSISSRR
jgi:glycosyltransferase involved in cell wall biosynthesis